MGKPTKEELQRWLKERRESKAPPPSPEQVRRELGWDLNTKNRGADRAR